ncbi:MAG: glutamine synthetase family protein [Ignavibacteria bacterium]|nr:glutamine synthetase family protein [Ignavibacteria bacterium]
MQNTNLYLALENPISLMTNKSKDNWTRKDFIEVIHSLQLERVTFHYVAVDGKPRQMQIPIQSRKQIEAILADGERVDGSSLFKGIVPTGFSDLYVVPIYKTAFLNPFDNKSLDFFCRFFDSQGNPASFTPDGILSKAKNYFTNKTGLELKALGELEFYLIFDLPKRMYLLSKQQGYHSSPPFSKTINIVNEMASIIAKITNSVKYCHNEVGYIENIQSEIPELNGKTAEQIEIEFQLVDIEELAYYLVLSAWIIRNVAYQHNCIATFFPKIDPGHAGNGLHFHLALTKNGKNIILNKDGELSDEALMAIGGLCHYAPSLTAFGNTVAASYLRLVPGQEAPTKVCWSKSNRNSLIRIPLAWGTSNNFARIINPQENEIVEYQDSRQTIEFRSPDGSALIHLVLAGIILAIEWGLSNPQRSLQIAEHYKVSNDPNSIPKDLEVLGKSCVESAEKLLQKRRHYERDGIFPPEVIDFYAKFLLAENDKDLNPRLISLPEEERLIESRRIMHRNLHKC